MSYSVFNVLNSASARVLSMAASVGEGFLGRSQVVTGLAAGALLAGAGYVLHRALREPTPAPQAPVPANPGIVAAPLLRNPV